jgi:hypothetical protein
MSSRQGRVLLLTFFRGSHSRLDWAMQAITVTESALEEFETAQAGTSSEAAAEPPKKRRSRFDAPESSSSAPGALPMQVLDQIRVAKARSALEGHAPMGWAIGYPCVARDPSGHWAPATVSAVTPEGYFQIVWEGSSGAPVTMHKADCRPRDAAVCPQPQACRFLFYFGELPACERPNVAQCRRSATVGACLQAKEIIIHRKERGKV